MWLLAVAFGQSDCLKCHPREVREHGSSAHARSLRPILETEFYRSLPDAPIGEARDGFLLDYERRGNRLVVTAHRGKETASADIGWAFGAGIQGVTPVARYNGFWLEHRVSFYPRERKFDLTVGHEPGISATAQRALGEPQPAQTILRCFNCHATRASPDLSSFEPGVQCERCHPGARDHARGKRGAYNPGKLDARASTAFCAECHRSSPPNGDWNDPVNVRFQPLRLAQSKCFASGKLSCVTCHRPHENAREDAAWYRAKCLSCHPDQANKGDCIECHMTRSSPLPHLTFTDHYIR